MNAQPPFALVNSVSSRGCRLAAEDRAAAPLSAAAAAGDELRPSLLQQHGSARGARGGAKQLRQDRGSTPKNNPLPQPALGATGRA